jgi:hypothetical protein
VIKNRLKRITSHVLQRRESEASKLCSSRIIYCNIGYLSPIGKGEEKLQAEFVVKMRITAVITK